MNNVYIIFLSGPDLQAILEHRQVRTTVLQIFKIKSDYSNDLIIVEN